jgi:hypothetical protein
MVATRVKAENGNYLSFNLTTYQVRYNPVQSNPRITNEKKKEKREEKMSTKSSAREYEKVPLRLAIWRDRGNYSAGPPPANSSTTHSSIVSEPKHSAGVDAVQG